MKEEVTAAIHSVRQTIKNVNQIMVNNIFLRPADSLFLNEGLNQLVELEERLVRIRERTKTKK